MPYAIPSVQRLLRCCPRTMLSAFENRSSSERFTVSESQNRTIVRKCHHIMQTNPAEQRISTNTSAAFPTASLHMHAVPSMFANKLAFVIVYNRWSPAVSGKAEKTFNQTQGMFNLVKKFCTTPASVQVVPVWCRIRARAAYH